MSRKISNLEADINGQAGIEQMADIHQDKSHAAPGTAKTIFPITGIGASAGGQNAYSKLLKALHQELHSPRRVK